MMDFFCCYCSFTFLFFLFLLFRYFDIILVFLLLFRRFSPARSFVHLFAFPPACPSILSEHRTFRRMVTVVRERVSGQCSVQNDFHHIIVFCCTTDRLHIFAQMFISNDMCGFKCQCTINICFRHVSHLSFLLFVMSVLTYIYFFRS